MNIERKPPNATDPELRTDLKAAIGARAELGPEMEDHVIDAFLIRLEDRVDARISVALKQASLDQPRQKQTSSAGYVIPLSLLIAIPLVAIAAGEGGTWGVAAVMACVLLVNFMYFLYLVFDPR